MLPSITILYNQYTNKSWILKRIVNDPNPSLRTLLASHQSLTFSGRLIFMKTYIQSLVRRPLTFTINKEIYLHDFPVILRRMHNSDFSMQRTTLLFWGHTHNNIQILNLLRRVTRYCVVKYPHIQLHNSL